MEYRSGVWLKCHHSKDIRPGAPGGYPGPGDDLLVAEVDTIEVAYGKGASIGEAGLER
jgi:hypothetical protein